MAANRFEHGGNIYGGNKACAGSLMDFSANINPFGLSAVVEQAIKENIKSVQHYPDPQATELRQEICRFYRVADERLVLGNGAAELFYLLCHVLRPATVLIPAPSFSEYERAALSSGAKIQFFLLDPYDGFSLSFARLAETLQEDTLIFFGHPNNPTGKLLDVEAFANFARFAAEKNCRIIVDESFIDFLPDADNHTCRWLAEKQENICIIHSLTKFFAIPGLRLGFGLFSPEMARKMRAAVDCWNVNSLAQVAGVAALKDEKHITNTKDNIGRLRDQLYQELSLLPGLKIFPSVANFLLLHLNAELSSRQICSRMDAKGILLRDCANYIGLDDRYIRIAVRSEAENRKFIDTFIKEIKNG